MSKSYSVDGIRFRVDSYGMIVHMNDWGELKGLKDRHLIDIARMGHLYGFADYYFMPAMPQTRLWHWTGRHLTFMDDDIFEAMWEEK